MFGLEKIDDLLTTGSDTLRSSCQEALAEMGVSSKYPGGTAQRGVFCSRTLNLRSIKVIGFDLDYTCVHVSAPVLGTGGGRALRRAPARGSGKWDWFPGW